jgi:mono/diheme cytochrome c family protein
MQAGKQMRRLASWWVAVAWLVLQAGAQGRGALVTYERVGVSPAERHTSTARLLALAVERGETPTPFVSPGLFRATFEAVVSLPLRERYQFRIEGRGSCTLTINGEQVLQGSLRAGRPLLTKEAVRLKKGDNQIRVVFESSAVGDGQFRLSWSGPDFGFEPPAPESLSHAASAELTAGRQLEQGMQAFVARRCALCHESESLRVGESAFRELDNPGPVLQQVGSRLQRDWIAAWLLGPQHFVATPRMPRFALSPSEAADVATYLGTLGAPLPMDAFPDDAAAHGQQRYAELGCVACHGEPSTTPVEDAAGRHSLAWVSRKWQAAALVAYLQAPRDAHPHGRMPDFRLSRADALALAAYLLQGPAIPLPAVSGDAAQGRRLAQRHGCAICHALDQPVDLRHGPRLPNLKVERGCLAEDGAGRNRAPEHFLSADERAALRAFLPLALTAPYRRSPQDYARRQFAEQRCTACHGLDGHPSAWSGHAERASAVEPLPAEQDPRAQGIPALSWLGGKLQPAWMTRFVAGEERSPRPWLTARMPAFPQQAAALVAGMAREHGYGDGDEPIGAGDVQAAIHGKRLLEMGTGFGCVQCHAVGEQPAVQVFERAGIDLALARVRLRREYYQRWLQDPPRIDADARMPKYKDADGKTAFRDVLGGDATLQFDAIWQYLATLQPKR